MYVIFNTEVGKFLALPESSTRHGSRGQLKFWRPSWEDLDHAVRFDTAEQAAAVIVQYNLISLVRLLTLEEAWAL